MSDLPEIPSPARSRHWLEYVSSGVAVVISVVSLWVAIGSEDANRKMVAASSWPFLQIDSSNGDGQGHSVLRFDVSNSGVGPAKVKTFEVFWRGKPYRTALDLLAACCGYKFQPVDLTNSGGVTPPDLISSARIAKTVIRAGDSSIFLTYSLSNNNGAVWNALDRERQRSKITFRICYCSVFDECWTDTADFNGDAGPRRVDTCPVPSAPYDQ